MKILIINAHSDNRGDEAAIKAMVDEVIGIYPHAEIVVSKQGKGKYSNMPINVKQIERFPKNESRMDQISFFLSIFSKGNIAITPDGKEYLKHLREADIVIHAPGGPSIGDIYEKVEWLYLWRLDLVRRMKKPYMFYAPSMGPFNKKKNDKLRKKVILGAEKVILRDPISINYVNDYLPEVRVEHAMDSAIQHDILEERVEKDFVEYADLQKFLVSHKKVIGITITDLKWHPKHAEKKYWNGIKKIFGEFIEELVQKGTGIIFIPQLFGMGNDYDLMKQFMIAEHTFILLDNDERYDAYFQQYLIGQLYAVVGMRYHSNIFSAKMGTPFISVSYEQKMKGFMQSVGLEEYCLGIEYLSIENLRDKFKLLEDNYNIYKEHLQTIHEDMRQKSYCSTMAVREILEGK